MNLRTKKVIRKRKKDNNLLLLVFIYALIIGISFFSVFAYTIYLDSECEKINKEIILKDQEIYKYQREVKNLRIKLENYSRKDYIVSKIDLYKLNLGTPNDNQVVNLSYNGLSYDGGRDYAYSY